jgi:hypothetical protein
MDRTHRISARAFVLLAAAALAGCTADEVMRPQIDVGTTQALPEFSAPAAPVLATVPQQLVTPQTMQQAMPQAMGVVPSAPGPVRQTAPILLVTPDGVVPAPAGMQPDAVVPETVGPAAAPGQRQPMQVQPVPLPEDDYEVTREDPGFMQKLAALPGAMVPDFLRPGGGGGSEASCRKQLKRLGVRFEDIASVGNGGAGGCGIAHPVKVSGLAGGISVKPAAVLNCRMALAFAEWVKKDVQPAARTRYLSGVDTIKQMSSYSCRTIGNKRGGRLSEHSFGNAIDIGGIVLNSGREVMVRKPGFFALRESSLLNKIRSDACERFTTVLGPGYDRAHADHFHLDLMSRKRTSCN